MAGSGNIRCPHCGKEYQANATYCWACGGVLDAPAQHGLVHAAQQANRIPTAQSQAVTSLVLGLLAFVFLCAPLLSGVLAVCAIVYGARYLKRERTHRGIAAAGVITGSVSAFVLLALLLHAPGLEGFLSSDQFAAWKNKPAPEFTLTDTSGVSHTLTQYRGKVVVLNFWSTW